MTAYIIRRTLYAVPILIGVNLITFVLFFFINTPDDMARVHLGTKRVTAEQIDRWKRERGYHLPYFYNHGWSQVGLREIRGEPSELVARLQKAGEYRIRVEAPAAGFGILTVEVQARPEAVPGRDLGATESLMSESGSGNVTVVGASRNEPGSGVAHGAPESDTDTRGGLVSGSAGGNLTKAGPAPSEAGSGAAHGASQSDTDTRESLTSGSAGGNPTPDAPALDQAGAGSAAGTSRFTFDLAQGHSQEVLLQLPVRRAGETYALTIALNPAPESSACVVRLEAREGLSLAERFTQTIFWQKSVRFLVLDFGSSDDGRNIGTEIRGRILPSLMLTVPIFIIGLLLEIVSAMTLAYFRGTYVDFWGVIASVILMSVSILFFVIGGQWLFGTVLKLVPMSGFDTGLRSMKFLLLPVAVGVIGGLGSGVRWYRTIFLEEMGKDYVRTARAKGLPESVVLFKHALKNAMIPILTGVVVTIPFLFIGSLVLESFFAIPGMGSFTLEAIQRQDFAIVQAMVFLGSALYILGLVLTDISYTLVDPRVRFG